MMKRKIKLIEEEPVRANLLTKRRLFKRASTGNPDAMKTINSVETRFEQQAIRIRRKRERIHIGRVVFI